MPLCEQLYAQHLDQAGRQKAACARAKAGARAACTPTRLNERSAKILQRVKMHRFRQVFALLAHGADELQLLDAVQGDHPAFSRLTAEVRADVEGAAVLRCAQAGLCAADVPLHDAAACHEALTAAHVNLQSAAANISNAAQCAQVNANQFADLMRHVVDTQPAAPRAYLLPDAHCRPADTMPAFKPAINSRSVALAEHRWQSRDKPVHHQLHEHAKAVQVWCC